MGDKIFFHTNCHDRLIDFIKGLAIIGVILLHNLGHTAVSNYLFFNLWVGMSVPLFIYVQSINTYRVYKNSAHIEIRDYFRKRTWKMTKRVFIPFIYSQLLIICLYCLLIGNDVMSLVKTIFISGGLGPGSYYPWAYLQIFALLPIVIWLYKKIGPIRTFLLVGGANILFESICSILGCSEDVFRLLAVRYIFLTVCGIHVMQTGVHITKTALIGSIIGMIFIIADSYTSLDFFPLAFKCYGFEGQHWIAYFYVSYLLIYFIRLLHKILDKLKVSEMIEYYGRDSYTIFVLQLIVFWIFRSLHYDSYDLSFRTLCFTIMTTLLPLLWSTIVYMTDLLWAKKSINSDMMKQQKETVL